MIFYFTGTGNSLAAAQTIARATDDPVSYTHLTLPTIA